MKGNCMDFENKDRKQDYRRIVHPSREIICMVTAWLEFCCCVKGREDCKKYVNSESYKVDVYIKKN